MGQFKDPELALAKEVVLQAQAQTTKWVTMTLVVSCVGVMGVTGIMMGVYLSGNLGKGDDSDDIQNNPVMAEAMKGVNLDSDVAQNHLDHRFSNPKNAPSLPTSPLSNDDDDDHQNTISSSKIPVISNAKERQRDFLASEINGLNMIGKRMMALPNLPTKLIASPIIVPPSAVNEAIDTEIPIGKFNIPENTVPLPNEVTIGPIIRDFTIPSNINSITNNILHDVQSNPQDNMIYNQNHDDEDESFEFDSPEIIEKTEEDSEEQRNEAEKTSEENSESEEVVEKTDIESHSKEISVLEVQSSESSVEMGSSAEITGDESSSEETASIPETDVTSLESVESSERHIAEGQLTVSKDDGSSSEEDEILKQISKEADVSSQSSSSNDDSIEDTNDLNNVEYVKPAEQDYDYNFEYENIETNDKFKSIVATSLTLPYKTNSKESMENLRSNAISVEIDKSSSDSYDSEEHSATKSQEIENKDGIYKSISIDSNEALGSADHSFEIDFQTVYSKTSKEAESGSISSEKNKDVSDKVQMSLGIGHVRVSSEELSSETRSDESGVAQQSSELQQSKLSRFPESDTSSEKDSDQSSAEKNSKEDINDNNSNESLAESKSEEKSKIDENTGSYEYSANEGSSSNSNEEIVAESSDADSSEQSQDERLNSAIRVTSSSKEEEGSDDVEFSAESSAHDGSISTNEMSDSMEDTLSQNRYSVESENKKSSESSISKESSEIDSKEASEESLSNSQSKQNIKDSVIDDSSSVVSESSEIDDDNVIMNTNYDDSSNIKYESQSHEASSSTDSSEELLAENNEDSRVVESVYADNDSKRKGDDDENSGNGLDEESKEDTEESDIIDQDVSKQMGDGSADHSRSESTDSSNESNNSDQSGEDLDKSSEKQGHNSDENLKENGSSQQRDSSSQNSDEQTKSSSVLMGILSNTMDNEAKLESSDFDQIKLDERGRESFDEHKINSNNLEDKSSEETSDESNDRSSKSVDDIETPNNDLSVVDVDDYDIPFSFKSQDSDFYSSYLYHEELHKSNNFEMSLSEKTDVNSKEDRSQEQSGGSKDSKESKESDINNRKVIGEPRDDLDTDNYYDDNMFTDFLRGILEKGKGLNSPTSHSVGTDNEEHESGESLEKSRHDGVKTDGSQQVDNNESKESQESREGTDAINPWTSHNGNQINENPSTSEFFRFGRTRNPFENGVIHGITNGFNAFVTTPRPFVPAADYDDDRDERRQQGRSMGLVGVSDDQTGGISSWNNGQHHVNTFANPHIGLNNHNGQGQHFGNEMIGGHQNFGPMGFSDTSSLGMQPNISPYNDGNTFSFHDLNHQPQTSHLNHGQSQDFSVHGNNNQHTEPQWMPHESGIQGNWDQTLPQVAAPQQLSPELGRNEQHSHAAEDGPMAMELPTLENIPQQVSPELGTNEQYSHAAESGPAAMELPTLENIPQTNLPSAVGDNLLSSSPSATGSDLASSFPSHLDTVPLSSSSLAHQDPVNDAWSTGNKQASLDEASRPDRNIFLDPQTNYFSNGVQRVAFGTPNEQLNFNINLINEQPQLNSNQPISNTQQNYGNSNHFNPHSEISAPFETIQTLPHSVDQVPHSVDQVPHYVDQAPQYVDQIPHSVDQIPHSVDQVNNHDDDSEERDDEFSAGSHISSMSSFVQPSEVYRNPFAVNDDVSDDHDHQQVDHNQHAETAHTDNEYDNNSNEDDNENEDDTDR